MKTLAYINFWGGFIPGDVWFERFTNFIKKNIDENIQIVNFSDSPDILMASCFGNINRIKSIDAKIKILFYGENLNRFPPYNDIDLLKRTFDLIVGFKYNNINEKIIRFPLWLMYYNYYNYEEDNNILKHINDSYNKNKNNKDNTCSLISSHDMNGLRKKIHDEISKYIPVLCGGNFMRNVPNIGSRPEDKINFISKSIYNICPENSEYEGYHTEKIFEAFEGGCIPIYWAIDRPEKEIINENSYCWIKDNISESISDVINNKNKYIVDNLFKPPSKYVVDNFYKTFANQIKTKLNMIPKQKIYGISYASRHFINRKNKIKQDADNFGLFDDFKCYSEEDIPNEFKEKYSSVWNDSTRGGGWWIWKPYIINEKLKELNDNDVLIYIDSGCTINKTDDSIKRFNEYIDLINNHWTGFLRFQLTHKEKDYTNEFTFNYFSNKFNTNDDFRDTFQILNGILLMRKTKFTVDFFNKHLEILEECPTIHTDRNNKHGETHRHDQSVTSLLYKYMNGNLVIDDETWFDGSNGYFGGNISLKYPFWAQRLRN